MDVESPEHLERLRNLPEIKAALLRFRLDSPATEARFERVSKNVLYWPAIESLSQRFVSTGHAVPVQEEHQIYGRPCWLLAVVLAPSSDAPFTIAVAAADAAPVETLTALIQSVSRDYWFGSYFFK